MINGKILFYFMIFSICVTLVFLSSVPPSLSILKSCEPCNNNNNAIVDTTNISRNSTLFTYVDNIHRIKVRFAHDWTIDKTIYVQGIGGLQLVAFYLPDVDKGFPFVRIGIDNLSKEFRHLQVNVYDYLGRSLKYKNSTGFPDFKLIEASVKSNNTLAGRIAYTILWTYTHPTYGIRKSMEIGTIIGNKGYFIDYTAASSKFLDHLPIVQKMISSFEITGSKYNTELENVF